MDEHRASHWLTGVAAAALVLLGLLTVLVRGETMGHRYAIARCAERRASIARRTRALDIVLAQVFMRLADRPDAEVR